MAVIESNDKELRIIIFDRPRVMVKFIDEDCRICKLLAPSFEKFSNDPFYSGVTFLRMHASENPVSSKEVKLSGTPFFATYKHGILIDCSLLSTEVEVVSMLGKLLLL